MTNIQFEKSIDGVLGTQTRGGRMVGADESTELWRHVIMFPNERYRHLSLFDAPIVLPPKISVNIYFSLIDD